MATSVTSETFPFNAMGLKAAVREVAAERPHFQYFADNAAGTCRYTEEDGTPGCIIGHAFFWLTGETVDECEMGGAVTGSTWVRMLGVDLDACSWDNAQAWRWLGVVQAYQDCGWSWGEAVGKADAGYHREQAAAPEVRDVLA